MKIAITGPVLIDDFPTIRNISMTSHMKDHALRLKSDVYINDGYWNTDFVIRWKDIKLKLSNISINFSIRELNSESILSATYKYNPLKGGSNVHLVFNNIEYSMKTEEDYKVFMKMILNEILKNKNGILQLEEN